MIVVDAEHIGWYGLRIIFKDGQERLIDVLPIFKRTTNPQILKFKDAALFTTFRIEDGTVCWGNNEFDINPQHIYEGKYNI